MARIGLSPVLRHCHRLGPVPQYLSSYRQQIQLLLTYRATSYGSMSRLNSPHCSLDYSLTVGTIVTVSFFQYFTILFIT